MNQLALIAKTQSLIAAGDIVGAESALVELADAEGDGALMVVLEQLPPKDILAVIREYDDSKESVINLLVTPEMFARAVVIEKQYKDLTRTHLRGMVNSVIFREDADPVEFLTAIGDLEGGSEALADYFSEKWSRIEAFARTGTFDASEDDGEMLSENALSRRPRPNPASNWTKWPTRTGCNWPGCCVTSARTCSSKCCWCCAPRQGVMRPGWVMRPGTMARRKTTARLKPATPTAARRPHRRATSDEESAI